jgi:KaiC/GvpD/RAD55 family RecA-like ATPase
LPRIPLIEDLTKGPVPSGSQILVEFDPASQWYNASLNIAAGWLNSGGSVSYITQSQPPDEVRSRLRSLGVAVEELERQDRLWVTDLYSASIGRKSKEKYAPESLKVADMSLWIAKDAMDDAPTPEFLVISDNSSVLDRFNDEKNWIELYLTRPIPMGRSRQLTQLMGFMSGIHSSWAYKQLEAAIDGIIDFRLDDTGEEPKNLIRVRAMRNVGFDGRWHQLKTDDRFEVTLEK